MYATPITPYIFFILTTLFLTSCNDSPTFSSKWEWIEGRDTPPNLNRQPIYRAKVPEHWRPIPVEKEVSIYDTRKPIMEWVIEDVLPIRITVHNFPSESFKHRIPPEAQVARWKNQFDDLDPTKTNVTVVSRGGFVGLFLETQGVYKEEPQAVLAWSMQLASCYYSHVACHQRRADYTIKATGNPKTINKYRTEIMDFANSFELIEELP